MAVVAHLVYKTVDPGDNVIDGIGAVVIAVDAAVDTSDALVKARAVTLVNAALGAGKLPTGYFTDNFAVASVYATAGEMTVINGRVVYNDAAA